MAAFTDNNFAYKVLVNTSTEKTASITGVNTATYTNAATSWGTFPSIPAVYSGSNTTYTGFKVVDIAAFAFQNKTKFSTTALTPTFLHSNLKSIGEKAFSGLALSGTLYIPDNIELIGTMAFYNCTLINNIIIGNLVNSDVISHLADLTAVLSQEITDRKNAHDSLHLLKAPKDNATFTGTTVIPVASVIQTATITTANVAKAAVGTETILSAAIGVLDVSGNVTFAGSTTTTGQWNYTVQPKYMSNVLATETFTNTKVAAIAGDSLSSTLNTLSDLATAIGNDPSFATNITTGNVQLLNSLNSEISSRGSAVSLISSTLSTSAASLTAADSALSTALINEISTRSTSVSTLSSALSRAASSLVVADSALVTTLNTEINTRVSAVSSLSSALSSVAASLVSVDSSLSTGLSYEISTRSSAVSSMSSSLSSATASLVAVDTGLSTALISEVSTRSSAVSSLSSSLSSATASLVAVDSSLSTALSNEVSTRGSAMSSLSTSASGATSLLQGGNLAMSTAFVAESTTLGTSVTSLSNSTATAATTLTSVNVSLSSVLSAEISTRVSAMTSVSTMAAGAVASLVNANANQSGAVSTEMYLRISQVASVSSVMAVALPSLSTAVSAISSALSTEISATIVNISSAVSTVIGGAPANFDTLSEIASEFQTNSSLALVASVLNQATAISTALSTATSTRISAVSSVSTALSGAVSSLTVANSNTSTVLLTEVNGRGASIVSVSTAINNANVALTAVNTTLSTTLYSENSTRVLSVASVSTGVNDMSASLVAVATGFVSTLSTEVVNRTVSVASLSTSLTNAISSLVIVDSTISSTLSSENVARISAIGSVSGVLYTSASAMQSAMSATSNSISTVSSQAALKATTSYLNNQVSTVLGGAPSSLDTISELAAALNNAYNFAGSITGVLGTKAAAADVDSISSTLALKANQVDYTSLSSVVVNKANAITADTVSAEVVALNNTATALVSDVSILKAGGGNVDPNSVSVGGVTLGDLVNWTKEIYVKIGSTNADGTINEKLNRLANPTNVSNVLSFEYDANGAVSKVLQLVTLKFDKSQTSVSVTGGVGNPTVSMSNLVLDSNNNYLFTFPYVGNAAYYTTNKTAVAITALESQYRLAPAIPTVSLSALDLSNSIYKNATPTITTPYAATTWDDGVQLIAQPITIGVQDANSVLKFDLGTYSTTDITIEAASGATAVSGKTNHFTVSGTSATFNVRYAPSLVATGTNLIYVSVMGSSSKLPSDTSTISGILNDYAQYAAPTLVSGSKTVGLSGSTYTLSASFDSVSMYSLHNASNQNVTNEVGHPNVFVLRKSSANWRPLMRQQNPNRNSIGAFSSNYDDPEQTYQPWSPDSQFTTSYSGNEIAKQFAYYASYWLNRLKIPTDQYLSVPAYTGRNYSGTLFLGTTIYYNAGDVFAGYLTFGMEGSTLVCRLSGYNSGTKYTFTVQSDAVATATAENNADAGTLRISNGLPNLMVVRTADTWKDKVPLITASLANGQTWGGVNGGYDIQFYDVTYGSSNQIAVQFAYFAQYWLNRLNVPVGKAMSVPVMAAQGAVGIFSFWKMTSSTYQGNLSTFSSNNYELQVQADAIAAGIAAQVKYVASVTYPSASLGQPVLKVRVPTAGALRASNYLTINGEGLAAHAAPLLSGSVVYSGSAGTYTATLTQTFSVNVSAVKVMKSDGTTIISSQAVSSGTATLAISYTTADISGSKSFYVVALGNNFGTDSAASVSQLFIDPPPVLSNFTIGTKSLADSAFVLTEPTSTITPTYGSTLSKSFTPASNASYANNTIISADGTMLGLSVPSSTGTIRMYAPGTYTMNAIYSGLERTHWNDLVGNTPGKKGTISMWCKFSDASTTQNIWTSRDNFGNGDMLDFRIMNGNLHLYGRSPDSTNNNPVQLEAITSTRPCSASNTWYHIFASWDMTVLNRVNVWVNGVAQTLTITTFVTGGTINYTTQNHGIGGVLYNPFVATGLGFIGQVYVNFSEYVDPATSIGKFYDAQNNRPIYLGANGAIPTGNSPIVHLDFDSTYSSTSIVNSGTGGNFVSVGAVSVGTPVAGTGIVEWVQRGGDIVGPSGSWSGTNGNTFAFAMSADGKTLAVGESGLGNSNPGTVSIYKYDSTKTNPQLTQGLPNYGPIGWSRITQLSGSGTIGFGWLVAMSADAKTLAVSAVAVNTITVYAWDGTNWTTKGSKIIGPYTSNYSITALSISANGQRIMASSNTSLFNDIGCIYADWNNTTNEWSITSASAFIPVQTTSAWNITMSADKRSAVLNTTGGNGFSVYKQNETTGVWALVGSAVAISNEIGPITSTSINADGTMVSITLSVTRNGRYGSAWVYRFNGTNWVNVCVIPNRIAQNSNLPFNAMVSADGSRLAVGGLGMVSVYDLITAGKITYTSSTIATAEVYGNLVLMKAVGTSTITASQTSASGTGTTTSTLTVIPPFAAPVLSNKVFALTATPGSYTFTATCTVDAAVAQIKIIKSGTADATLAVSGGSVSISMSYATADLYTSFYVVAVGNATGGTSNYTSQVFFDPPPVLSNFTVGTRTLGDNGDNAFVLTEPTSTMQVAYTSNSITPVGQSFTGLTTADWNIANLVKISADGTTIGIVLGTSTGTVRMYKLISNVWTQWGGDITGTAGGQYAGVLRFDSMGSSPFSMSADGTLLTIVQSGLGGFAGLLNVYKYDVNKTTAQTTNPALPTYGPINWSRVATMQLLTTTPNVVLSADGKTMAVSDGTLRMYRSSDGGTTWTQRGEPITDSDPLYNLGFFRSISISANGLAVLAAPTSNQGNAAKFMCYEWIGGTWIASFIYDFNHSNASNSWAISADGKVCTVQSNANVARYTKNVSGVWTLVRNFNVGQDVYHINTSADGNFISFARAGNNPTYGDVEIHRWNGSAYVAVINNRTIQNRTTDFMQFNSMLSSDGTRVVVGGKGKVDVYDLVATSKTAYTSSDPAVASVYGTLVLMKAGGTSTITATQTNGAGSGTITAPLTVALIPQFAAPVLSNKVFAFTATPGAYTFTATCTVDAAVAQVKIIKSGTADTILSVSGGSVSISMSYATADLYTAFHVVALTNGLIGSQNSVSQVFFDPPPVLSNFVVGTKSLADGAFVLTEPTSTTSFAYTLNSITRVGQAFTGIPVVTADRNYGFAAHCMISQDGKRMVYVIPSSSGTFKIFELQSGLWGQVGGDIVGTGAWSGINGFGGEESLSISADGTIVAFGATNLTTNALYANSGEVSIYQYDSSKTTAQLSNGALATYGPAGWNRIGRIQSTEQIGIRVSLSANGKTIAFSGPDYIKVYSYGGGTTWNQMGSTISGTQYGMRSLKMSANGFSLVQLGHDASTKMTFHEWNGSNWIESIIVNGIGSAKATMSDDGKTIVINNDINNSYMRTYTRDSSTGVWSQINAFAPWLGTVKNLMLSSNGKVLISANSPFNANQMKVQLYAWSGTGWNSINNSLTYGINDAGYFAASASINSDGTRFTWSKFGVIDIYDLNTTSKTAYTSSAPAVASVYGNLVLMNSSGTSTITATQTNGAGSGTITSTLTVNPLRAIGTVSIDTLAVKSTFSGTTFNTPRNNAIDLNGNIYVVDTGNNLIKKFTSAGVYVSQFGSQGTDDGQFSGPTGIAISYRTGNIYVSDAGNHRIQMFNGITGAFMMKFGSNGSTNGLFNNPWGIAIDNSDYVYVSDAGNHRIQKFTSTGTYVSQFGSQGTATDNGKFASPKGIQVLSNGNIIVLDTDNNRLQTFTGDGVYVSQFGSQGTGDGKFSNPIAFAIDAVGNIVVADTYNNRIQIFTSAGTYVSKFGSLGTANGQFNTPMGVSIDSTGNIIVSDTNNNRVQILQGSPPLELDAMNGVTVKFVGNSSTVSSSAPRFITQNVRGTSELFAVVDDSANARAMITNYATNLSAGSGRNYFTKDGNAVPFNNIVTTLMTYMRTLFMGAQTFNEPIASWDTSNVLTMYQMFWDARAFNQPIGNWNTTKVTSMDYMTYNAYAFRQNISGWNTVALNRNISPPDFHAPPSTADRPVWGTTPVLILYANNATVRYASANALSSVPTFVYENPRGTGFEWFAIVDNSATTMIRNYATNLSSGASSGVGITYFTYNGNLVPFNNIVTTRMTYMRSMLENLPLFNQPMASWDTSNVTDMYCLFANDYKFNQNISKWNTSNVTDMGYMLYENRVFNQNISGWNTLKIPVIPPSFSNGAALSSNYLPIWGTAASGWASPN